MMVYSLAKSIKTKTKANRKKDNHITCPKRIRIQHWCYYDNHEAIYVWSGIDDLNLH